jgi:hypothetical protein
VDPIIVLYVTVDANDALFTCREDTLIVDAFSMFAVRVDVTRLDVTRLVVTILEVARLDVVRELRETRLFAVSVPLNRVLYTTS